MGMSILPDKLSDFAQTQKRKLEDWSSFRLLEFGHEVDYGGEARKPFLLDGREVCKLPAEGESDLIEERPEGIVVLDMKEALQILLERDSLVTEEKDMARIHAVSDGRHEGGRLDEIIHC